MVIAMVITMQHSFTNDCIYEKYVYYVEKKWLLNDC
jgi:hypothetical protein